MGGKGSGRPKDYELRAKVAEMLSKGMNYSQVARALDPQRAPCTVRQLALRMGWKKACVMDSSGAE